MRSSGEKSAHFGEKNGFSWFHTLTPVSL